MLKTRIVTALFIAAITGVILFLGPPVVFVLAIVALLLVGSREFATLAGLDRLAGWGLVALQAVVFGLMWHFRVELTQHAERVLGLACLGWCLLWVRLYTFDRTRPVDGRYRVLSVLSALASLSGAGFSLVWLHQQEHGAFLILVLLFTIWAADIGAYFVGRAFGRTRLAPQISPGKTREGLLGGVMLALLVAYLTAQIAGVLPRQVGLFVLLTAVTAVSAAGGDLFISLHKRAVGVKDSGKLLPGHGGVLDRFDSLLAGAPFFALGSLLLAGQ